jgi:caspase domain-containing protein
VWRRLPLLLALVLAAFALPAEARRVALVIGNDDYKNVQPLRNARQDAKAISEVLEGLGFTVTLKQDLTLSAMKATLREFKAHVAGGDEVVFYFSGHGVQFEGTNYLVPTDIVAESQEQVVDDAIPLQRILDDLHDQKARFALAIVDACRDNPFKGRGRAIGGRGLAPVSAASGQMVMYSAGTGQEALDRLGPDDKSPNGVFTRVLIKHMTRPGVPADRMLKNVSYEVIGLANSVHHEQVPAVYDQTIGEFFFKPGAATEPPRAGDVVAVSTAPPTPRVHLPTAGELDESYWDRIKDSTDPQDFKDYNLQFPKGAHAAESSLMTRRLAKQAAAASQPQTASPAPASKPVAQGGGGSAGDPTTDPLVATGPPGSHPGYITTTATPGVTLTGALTLNPDGSFRYDGTNGVVLRGTLNVSNPNAVAGNGVSMMPKKLGFIPKRFPDGSVSTAVVLKGKIVNGVLQGQYADKFETGLFIFNLARTN